MAHRTFAVGDIHGDLDALRKVIAQLPPLDAEDTLVFLGDYLDRGFQSAQVVRFIRTELPQQCPARIVALRGNHEDGWLRVVAGGWTEFTMPPGNGCLACLRSYTDQPYFVGDAPSPEEWRHLFKGDFFPKEDLAWMESLPYFHEDEHAIYVHAGLPKKNGAWVHPSQVEDKAVLLWIRTEDFFRNYRGKRLVVGHTSTDCLPPELSVFTPEDPLDMWESESVLAIDTGCGKGGFLTIVELPAKRVYESRS